MTEESVSFQLLDEGRLTDGQGRIVDFRNALIIMTSNLGSDLILQTEEVDSIRDRIDVMLKATFRPEFLNRIDEIITFRRLGKEQIFAIVDIQIKGLIQRLSERKIGFRIDEEAKQHLADLGFDPAFGARPLRRTIQNEVQNPLARALLSGTYREGDTIVLQRTENGLSFELDKTVAEAAL